MGGEIPQRPAARRESSGGKDGAQPDPTCHHISQQLLLLADIPPGYSQPAVGLHATAGCLLGTIPTWMMAGLVS